MKPYRIINALLLSALLALAAGCRPSASESEEEHGHGEEGSLVLTRAQIQAVGIETGTMEFREMADVLTASGRLEVAPQGEAVAVSALPGTVARLLVKPGDRVKAGQAVAYVDAPELRQLRQQALEAREETKAMRQELLRQEALAREGAGVRKNLEAARNALDLARLRENGIAARLGHLGYSGGETLAVKAAISGTVTAVEATVGGYADMQTPLARIVNLDALYANLFIPEKDADAIKPGMAVELQLTNLPSRRLPGEVEMVTPQLDPSNLTVPVRVRLDRGSNREGLVAGMAVKATVQGTGVLSPTLPDEAVVSSGGRSYIFVQVTEEASHDHDSEDESHAGHRHDAGEASHDHEGEDLFHFEKVEVVKGKSSRGFTAVTPLEPLPEDARIVVRGAFYLNSMSTDHGEHNH